MQLPTLAVIGIGLAAMFFGYFFGLMEGRGQGYKKRRTEEGAEKEAKAAAEAVIPPPSPPVPPNERSLLKLNLDERNRPGLEMDGQKVETAQLKPEERKRLIELMLIMRPWVEGGGGGPRPGSAPAQPVVTKQDTMPLTAAAVPPSKGEAIARTKTVPVIPAAEAAPTSMVGQIDAILQALLISSPLRSKDIRLMESPEGGVVVLVGNQRYAGVAEVPEAEVQAAIRAAIAEWEKRYTPG